MKNLVLIIPFYNGLSLIDPLMKSINTCSEEIIDCGAEILLINDSPLNLEVGRKLATWTTELCHLGITLLTNEKNVGFVKTINQGFNYAVQNNADVIILNSDVVLFPGALREIVRVAHSDDRIGFVSPRSNNATICTFPHGVETKNLDPIEAYNKYLRTSQKLEDISYVPVVVGFCCFISLEILRNVGFFDEVFGDGYSEEVDLMCRAARMGLLCALANRAFVWHMGEASFSTKSIQKEERERENFKIITAKYPEYLVNLHSYFTGKEYLYEKILSNIYSVSGKLKIGFDFRSFGCHHNGTFEAGIKILEASIELFSEKYEFHVDITPAAANFHKLSKLVNLKFTQFGHENDGDMAMIIRIGQPFSEDHLPSLYNSSVVVGVHMLDIIAYDCSHLKVGFNRKIWDIVFQYSDIVYGISDYSSMRFKKIFRIGHNTNVITNRLSMALNDYEKKIVSEIKEQNKNEYILIVGNNFAHKNMVAVIASLSKNLPEMQFRALCDKTKHFKNVEFLSPGHISETEMEKLYSQARAVIFPSLYEGFGFPIFHALAARKIVIVYDSPLNRELSEHSNLKENIRLFRDNHELVSIIQSDDLKFSERHYYACDHDWKTCAAELVETAVQSYEDITPSTVINRLRSVGYMLESKDLRPTDPFSNVLLRVAHTLNRSAKRRWIYSFLRSVYRATRYVYSKTK